MTFRTIEKKDLPSFIDRLIQAMEVVGVREKVEGKYEFAPLESSSQLRLDYDVTLLSPEEIPSPLPGDPVAVQDRRESHCEPVLESRPLAIVGVHPYDLKAISQLDRIFADANRMSITGRKRQETVIIGVDIKRASSYAFCKSMNSAIVQEGFDLFLTDIGESYVVAVGTKKGQDLLEKYATSPTLGHEGGDREAGRDPGKNTLLFSLNAVTTPYASCPSFWRIRRRASSLRSWPRNASAAAPVTWSAPPATALTCRTIWP